MKANRKRFITLALALLMTVAVPLSTFAEASDDIDIGIPVVDDGQSDPTNEEIEQAKASLEGAISAANTYKDSDDYKNSDVDKSAFEKALREAEEAKNSLDGSPSEGDVKKAKTATDALNSKLQALEVEISLEKGEKENAEKLKKAKEDLQKAITEAEAFKVKDKYTKGVAADKKAFDSALKEAKKAKDADDATEESLNTAKSTLTEAQNKLENAETEADTFVPKTEKLTVEKGGKVDIKAGLRNVPANAKVAIKKDVDTSTAGKKIGILTVTFYDGSQKDVEITVEVTEKAPLPSTPTLVISGENVNSDGYVSGYVKADGSPIYDATVTFYTNKGVFVAKGQTDGDGYFKFFVGTQHYGDYNSYYEYYNGHKVYYSNGDYYYYDNDNVKRYLSNYYHGDNYRCGRSGYLVAKKALYTESVKTYVRGNCDYRYDYRPNSRYDYKDYRVYPTSIKRTTSKVRGYLPNEKGRTVSVYSSDYYYDGYYNNGYYDYYGNWHYYDYYDGYYDSYHRNSKYYLGSATVGSDGYFTIYFNRNVPTSESLYYYVDEYKDGRYATVPTVNQADSGTMVVKGKAGSYAGIRVENAQGTKLGSTTADSDGNFTCYLDRKLSVGETIKVIASESTRYDSSTSYTVVNSALTGDTYARIAYIAGYPDGTFKPSNNVTRAEAAQMFATLLNGASSFGTSSVTKFSDANNEWYSPAVNYIVGKDLLKGYSDGTFKPNSNITRAEFAQMISGYLKAGYAGSSSFKDVKGHWASDAIDKVYGNKAVEGYPDGTFKPNKTLTRAEAVTVLNAIFNRYTTSASLKNISLGSLKTYSDMSSSHWAYYQVLDASNAHVSQKVTPTTDEEVWK